MNRSLSDLISTVNRSLVWLFWISNDLTVGSYILLRSPVRTATARPIATLDSTVPGSGNAGSSCAQACRSHMHPARP